MSAMNKRVIGFIGDVSWPDHDGDAMIVYHDGTARYLQQDQEEDESFTFWNFWISLDKVERPSNEWFDLIKVGKTVDVAPVDLASALNSDDVRQRASAYYDLISYYGPQEFDGHPFKMSRADVVRRIEPGLRALRKRR